MKSIDIKGARLHNLKGFDISIPKNQLVVATGVSGSGKSSLVFDIVFEEGRRQYLQSLGILAGFEDEEKFDSISGLGPTIAVQQSIIRQSNPRSTVGSRTGILNLLAVLFTGEGRVSCSACESPTDDNLICPRCGNIEERLPASYFSYNAPNGMCIKCSGRGSYYEINIDKLAPDQTVALQQIFDSLGITPGFMRLLQRSFKPYLKTPFTEIPDEIKEEIIYGHHVNSNKEKRSYCLLRIFQGRLYWEGEDRSGIYTMSVCSDCRGFRIGEDARRVLLKGRHIGELGLMTISELHGFLHELPAEAAASPMAKNLIGEITRKTGSLVKSRLGHLSLYREMPTLSGGEIQRLFLHSHLDSRLDSLIYILDEPTVGLHEFEKADLLKSIVELKEMGNTVIVVEHDRRTIELADHIIDFGPKAGAEGGRVVYQGGVSGLLECPDSITGGCLSGRIAMPARKSGRDWEACNAERRLTLRGAKTNNLKDITVSIPLGGLVGIAGVSGSGKSSLISDTLVPLLKGCFHKQRQSDASGLEMNGDGSGHEAPAIITVAERLEGAEHLSGYVEISQAPIGRNSSSNPVTYIGIWEKIRALFAAQPEAGRQGLTTGHFSFNSKGACSACGGSGREKIWLGGDFFIHHTCPQCHGKRYNEEALSVLYQGRNIVDVLEMSVSDAAVFFKDQPGISHMLAVMSRIGMGYIKLGQPTPSLSGGEAQRIKLAREIGRRRKAQTLYVLDEPTTGLSLYDTARLIQLLDELIGKGNSVVVIEHDPAVLQTCDWIVELGPGGGVEGGRILSEGTPRQLKDNPDSITGRYL